MESGNSGSMQSSSGGEEDQYNDSSSRANPSLPPSFLMPNNPLSSSSSSIPHHHHHDHHDPSSSSNYLNFINNNPFNMMPQFPNLGKNIQVGPSSSVNPSRPSPDPTAGNALNITKNPKKRTRASRRAPTTVLTTDTSNFRAMVQEFTGIPAPPFSTTGSPFSSRRFDIFRSSSSSTPSSQGIMDHQNNNSLYYNPFLGPPTQKIRISLPPNNTYTVDSTNISSVPMNYQVIPDLPLPRPPNNMNIHIQQNNNQNPNLSFQSLLSQHHQSQELHHHQQHSDVQYDVGLLPQDGHQDQRLRTHLNVSAEEFVKQNNITNVSSARTEGTSVDSWICPAD